MDILHNDINLIRSDLIDLLEDVDDDVELIALLKSVRKTDVKLYDIMLLLQSHINTDKVTTRNTFIKLINKVLDIQSKTLIVLESNNIKDIEPRVHNASKHTVNKSTISTIFSKEPKLLYLVFFFIIMIFGFVIYRIDPEFANVLKDIRLTIN